jgi:hypothetical protein
VKTAPERLIRRNEEQKKRYQKQHGVAYFVQKKREGQPLKRAHSALKQSETSAAEFVCMTKSLNRRKYDTILARHQCGASPSPERVFVNIDCIQHYPFMIFRTMYHSACGS